MNDRDALRKQSLEAFEEFLPGLHAQLVDYQPLSEIVELEDGGFDTVFRGQHFYNRDPAGYVRRQLDNFPRVPHRFTLSPPTSKTLDEDARPFLAQMLKRATDAGMDFQSQPVGEESYFVMCFGLGLGTHLDELVEMTQCRAMAIIEPNLEFIHHSLELFDWRDFLDRMQARKGSVSLFVCQTGEQTAQELRGWMRTTNPCSVDGLSTFFHYNHPVFLHTLRTLQADADIFLAGLGFFYDETIMIRNAHANLYSGEARVYLRPEEPRLDVPVFVVGSGPSLDKDMDFLRANADRAVIVSCGSAIRPLMLNGIRPDFQIEIENIEVHPVISQVAQNFDVSEIKLVTASTVDQSIVPFFDEVLYYFRSSLSPYPIFCETKRRALVFSSPTVVNAGLSFAQELGFRQFYLFGTDMGTKWKGRHHSQDTYHYTEVRQKKLEEGLVKDPDYARPVRGNLGGTAYTNTDMYWTIDTIKLAIKSNWRGRTYYNCSDGAFIEGTIPQPSRFLELPEVGDRKQKAIDACVEQFPVFSRELFDAAWQDEMMVDAIEGIRKEVVDALDSVESLNDKGYISTFNPIMTPTFGKWTLGVAHLFRGTLWQMLLAYEYYASRLVEDRREELASIAREEFDKVLGELCEKGIDRLGKLSEKSAAGIEIDPYD